MRQQYSQGVALGCTIPALQAGSTTANWMRVRCSRDGRTPAAAQGCAPVRNWRNLQLGSTTFLWENRAIMSETENPFSLARVALSAGGRAKTHLPSLTQI